MDFVRIGPPARQPVASTSYSLDSKWCLHTFHLRRCQLQKAATQTHARGTSAHAILQDERPAATRVADADRTPEVGRQLAQSLTDGEEYITLSDAQELVSEVRKASQPTPPKLLSFCQTGEQELRLINYTANGALVGLSLFLAASQLGNPGSAAAGPSAFGAVTALAQQGWQLHEFFVDSHPVVTKAVISGTVYGLGDLTAQTYEGRSWREFDAARIIRSSLCGFIAHGPLSHFFYEKMDRFFIISKYFEGGDAWYAPLAKIAIDQTVFAATWNSLYYFMLGAMKLESPGKILGMVRSSWWELLKAGWRLWPVVHIITYTVIPCQDRVLWVDMVELAWVTILSMYGQQRREHAGAAACALPGVAGEGGLFTDDILRGMTAETQVVFQSANGEPIVKRLDEVLIEAASLEAKLATSLDKATRYTQPVASQEEQQE